MSIGISSKATDGLVKSTTCLVSSVVGEAPDPKFSNNTRKRYLSLGMSRPCEPAPAVSDPKGTVILESDETGIMYFSYMQLFMISLIKKMGL